MATMGGGIQHHHKNSLRPAGIHAVNLVQYLAGVAERSDDPEYADLERIARDLCLRIGAATRRAEDRLAHLAASDPARFWRCRSGAEPWPDERAEGFVPVCRCGIRCLWHVHQPPWATEADCNCNEVCAQHGTVKGPGEPVPPLPTP